MQIPLGGKYGKGKYATIDAEDFDKVRGFNWLLHKKFVLKKDGSYSSYVYERVVARAPGGRTIYLHRLVKGVTDPQLDVNHEDHDTLNNTKGNLTIMSHSDHGKESARIRKSYKRKHLCDGLQVTSTSGTET